MINPLDTDFSEWDWRKGIWSDTPTAGSLSGTELVAIMQGGVLKRTTCQNVANLGGGGGGGGGLQVSQVTLSHADILALPTTAFPILPAAGVGKFIWTPNAILISNFVAGYTNIDSSAFLVPASDNADMLWLYQLGATPGAGNPTLGSFLNNTTKRIIGTPFNSLPPGTDDFTDNEGLVLFMINGSAGNLTGGDPANKLTVVVTYLVLSVP